jgi:hypothetical protein
MDLIDAGRAAGWIGDNAIELSIPTPTTEVHVRGAAYLVYRTLRKSGIRWAMWRAGSRPDGETATAHTSVEGATEPIQDIERRTNDVTARLSGTVRDLPAVLARRNAPGLTRVALAVLPLSVAAVLGAAVAGLLTIPLTAALLAGMGVGGLMLLRSRRPA